MKIIFTCLFVVMLCASNSEAELTISDYFSLVEQFKTTKDQDANILQLTDSLKKNESDVDLLIKRGREYILKAVQLEAGTCLIRDLNKPDEMVCPDPLVSSKVFFKNEISEFYANALQDLTNALRIDNKAYSAFYTKAIYFNLIGEFEKSIENINKYIELRPNKEAGYFLRAFYYKNQKSVSYMDSAIKDFTKVISMNPKSSGAYFYRSQSYQNKLWLLYPSGGAKSDKAANKLVSLVLADLNSAIKIKKETDFYYEKARFYAALNKPDLELEVYKEMITVFPDNHMNIWSVASKYVDKKEYRKSIPYFTKAIQVCVKNEPIDNNLSHMEYSSQPCNMYYRQRAETNIKLNNISDAIDDYYELCNFNTIQKNGKSRPIKDCSKLDSLNKAKALGDNWTYYFETDNTQFYYDKRRINKNGKDKSKVWVMSVKSPDATISERASSNMPVAGYNYFSHTINLYELACHNKTISILSSADYSTNGTVLSTFKYDDFGDKQTYNDIFPNSMSDDLYKAVCKGK